MPQSFFQHETLTQDLPNHKHLCMTMPWEMLTHSILQCKYNAKIHPLCVVSLIPSIFYVTVFFAALRWIELSMQDLLLYKHCAILHQRAFTRKQRNSPFHLQCKALKPRASVALNIFRWCFNNMQRLHIGAMKQQLNNCGCAAKMEPCSALDVLQHAPNEKHRQHWYRYHIAMTCENWLMENRGHLSAHDERIKQALCRHLLCILLTQVYAPQDHMCTTTQQEHLCVCAQCPGQQCKAKHHCSSATELTKRNQCNNVFSWLCCLESTSIVCLQKLFKILCTGHVLYQGNVAAVVVTAQLDFVCS